MSRTQCAWASCSTHFRVVAKDYPLPRIVIRGYSKVKPRSGFDSQEFWCCRGVAKMQLFCCGLVRT